MIIVSINLSWKNHPLDNYVTQYCVIFILFDNIDKITSEWLNFPKLPVNINAIFLFFLLLF